jgi:hypothetical protein
MSFDQEPEIRYLLYHAESDCVFETYNGSDVRQSVDSGECADVTDLPDFEERFKREQDEKRQKGTRV